MRMSARSRIVLVALWVPGLVTFCGAGATADLGDGSTADGSVCKALLRADGAGRNLLDTSAWQGFEQGFERSAQHFVCDNGANAAGRRGAFQRVVLDQTEPQPIVAAASSKAEGVTGTSDSDYAVYVDLVYRDGTELWGQSADFRVGTHDWQRVEVVIFPERPIKSLSCYLVFRGHAGKVWFRDPTLHAIEAPAHGAVFDGVPVLAQTSATAGFQLRDVAANGDFVRIGSEALGLRLQVNEQRQGSATFFDVTVRDTIGKDRAVTLVYAIPIPARGAEWLAHPRERQVVAAGREYLCSTSCRAGAGGRLSTYPLGAVAVAGRDGIGLGLDMSRPAFFRIGYSAGSGELWIAYDLGLTREKAEARLRFCRFEFAPEWGFRAALAAYYQLFPDAFQRRIADQGLWMPFAHISRIKGYEDFGFRFKEGNDETAWDDAHGIITFHYTEPLTWWMPMPRTMPRTMEAATAEAHRLAERGRREAKALFSSGYHDDTGSLVGRFREEPWNRGIVWSMNSMPGIVGEVTDFKTKWNPQSKERLYGPRRRGDLDGEYIDSSEGYVTDLLDFRRDHFATADTPLVFSLDTRQPAIFRGLIAFEYVRAIAVDVHGMDKLMMANATPDRLCWLAPMLDVMGTETDWNPRGRWRPMSDADLLYRRALCKGKPYCFLMNTDFENFPPALVEKYMKRSLAYGFFPGFFSHNAAEGHYFTRPELYERDRPLFQKYMPLCKLIAEAGWEPVTGARSSDDHVHIERFGREGVRYLTVYNDSPERRGVTLTLESKAPATSRDLVRGKALAWTAGKAELSLDGEDVAVVQLSP